MARILVVDDASFMRNNLRRVLVGGGHQVSGEAEDGAEAVRLYEELAPDVVTMDITMPVMDGIQALREIRRMDPDSCVVMCSASSQQEMVVEAIHAGAAEFIVKPFRPERVIEAIAHGLSAS
ncbi:MAG: response regulator [Actinomycetota bacterium]